MENMEKIETLTQSQEKGKIFENYGDFYKEYKECSELRSPIVRIHNKKIENSLLVDSADNFVDSYAFKITNYYANMNIEDENRKVITGFVLKNDTISQYQIELVKRE